MATTRGPGRPPLGYTLGFFGSGEVNDKAMAALLGDFIKGKEGKSKLVFPMTKQYFTAGSSMQTVFDWAVAQKSSVTIEAITDDTTSKLITDRLDDVRKTHKAADVGGMMMKLLLKAKDPRLVLLFDEEDDEVIDLLAAASKSEIVALDLTSGLEDLVYEESDEEDEEEEDEEEEDDEEEEEFDPDTAEFSDLKAFAKENDIEVPPRTRSAGYRAIIKEWLAGDAVEEDEDEEDAEDEEEDVVYDGEDRRGQREGGPREAEIPFGTLLTSVATPWVSIHLPSDDTALIDEVLKLMRRSS